MQSHPQPSTGSTSGATRFVLPLLLLVSGFCGISYEILYARLLGNLLGNQFTINATVLLTFLTGIGLGTLYAHRFVRWLWAIELGIGVYAAGMAAASGSIDRLLYTTMPALGANLWTAALVSLVLLAIPAFLIGCSVPLFAAYLEARHTQRTFSFTYGIYNLGAVATAVALEFALLRSVGLRNSTLLIASLNALVALGLLVSMRTAGVVPRPPVERMRFPARVLTALALGSVASAVFQLLMIRLAEFVFGPFNETFAIVLATVLLGISLGSLAAGRMRLSFNGSLLVALVGILGLLMLFEPIAAVYADLFRDAAKSHGRLVALKFAMVALMMGLPAIGFGATIPAILRSHRDVARESGQLLFVSSMGNAAGFVLMAFVLHRYFDYGPMLIGVAALTATAILVRSGWSRPGFAAVGLAILAAGAGSSVWNESLLYIGHISFRSAEELENARQDRVVAERYKDGQDVFAITYVDEVPYFFINGYVSIPLGGEKPNEEVVGTLSSMYSPRLDRALVLGMGSGATAGSVALSFENTDVVEINGVVLENLDRLAKYNFDIDRRPGVRIVHDDGIHFIKTVDGEYSLILNTVTSPLFFSSSKLYTLEFFDLVRSRLTDDGVYVTWIDGMIGDRGLDIVLNTVGQRFEHCWLNYLTTSYYFLACSDAPPGLHQLQQITTNTELANYFANEYSLPVELLPYRVLTLDALALRSAETVPVNTIDLPVLEFEMARIAEPWYGDAILGFKRRLRRQIDPARLETSVPDWSLAGFVLAADLALDGEGSLYERIVLASDEAGLDEASFERAVLKYGERLGSLDGWVIAGRLLLDHRLFGTAIEVLERARAIPPSGQVPVYEPSDIACYRGLAYEGLQDPHRARLAFDEALAEDPQNEQAREALGRLVRGGSR